MAPGGAQPGVSLDKATPPSAPVPASTKASKTPARRKEAGVETIAPSLRVAGKRRQSPLLLIVSLLLILGCAGIFGALYMNAGNRSDVLVAAQDIPLGHVIEATDLTRAEVAGNNFSYIPWTQRDGVIGTTAVVTIPKGGMLSASQLANETTIPDGFVSVGLDLQPGQFPQELTPGRKVRIFDGAPESQGRTVVDAAQVVRIDREASNSANALVSLALKEADAEKVAAMRETVVLSMHPLNK